MSDEQRPAMTESKVDVSAVMDRAARQLEASGFHASAHAMWAAERQVVELVATQRETLRMLEAAHRQLGMWTGDNKRIQRAIAALAACTPAKSEGR